MTKKSKTKELEVKNNYAVSSDLMEELSGMGLGAGDNIDNEDILVPKLLLTQGISEIVAKGEASAGVYINSITKADHGKNLEVIVLDSYKTWQVFKKTKDDSKPQYVETLDYEGNESLEVNEELENGDLIHRDKVLGYYVLKLDEIKQGAAFPYIIDFKRTSRRSGQSLASDFAKLRTQNLPSFAKIFTIGTEFVQDQFNYYVKTVDMGRTIEREELQVVKQWLSELKQNKSRMKGDDSDLQEKEQEQKEIEAPKDEIQF